LLYEWIRLAETYLKNKIIKIILQFLVVTMDGFNMSPPKMPFSSLPLHVCLPLGVALKKDIKNK